MTRNRLPSLALALLLSLLFSLTSAQTSSNAASASATMGQRAAVAVNVPNNSTDALFLNFRTAASGVGWGAIGFGASMSNSLMFIVRYITLAPKRNEPSV